MTADDVDWWLTQAAMVITLAAWLLAVLTRHELAAADCTPVLIFMVFYASQVADYGDDPADEEPF